MASRPCRPARRRGVRSGLTGMKTEKSRRTLGLPAMVADALRAHNKRQTAERLAAAAGWNGQDLVFCTRTGSALDAANVRREFRGVCKAAGIGEHWTPRELRHSFVSLMSHSGACRGDRAASGALKLPDHRGDLQTRTAADSYDRRRSHGQAFQHPRILIDSGGPHEPPTPGSQSKFGPSDAPCASTDVSAAARSDHGAASLQESRGDPR
jgi:hypothetical protein